MAPAVNEEGYTQGLAGFLSYMKDGNTVDSCIQTLISLLKRRQIKNSRPTAIAVGKLFQRIIYGIHFRSIDELLHEIETIGEKLIDAQPREKVILNIVRRVIGIIREEKAEAIKADQKAALKAWKKAVAEQEKEDEKNGVVASKDKKSAAAKARNPALDRPLMLTSHTSYAVRNGATHVHSLFNLLSAAPSTEVTPSGLKTPQEGGVDATELSYKMAKSARDSKAEVCEAVAEMVDELLQSDERIASYAPEHIHSGETILTHTSSRTVQQFLLKAASKRKFTVIYAESYPNDNDATYKTIVGGVGPYEDEEELGVETFQKSLTAAGLTVIIITDSAVFALMSRVNKVILATHTVLANGGLVAASGARLIAKAAFRHRTPVIVVSGIYKLSPQYPYAFADMIEYGDSDAVMNYKEAGKSAMDMVTIENPLYDYVPPDLIQLYITNLGAHAPSWLYRIVADQYNSTNEEAGLLQNGPMVGF